MSTRDGFKFKPEYHSIDDPQLYTTTYEENKQWNNGAVAAFTFYEDGLVKDLEKKLETAINALEKYADEYIAKKALEKIND